MMDELIVLGSGGSLGVPIVGCSCDVCKSDNSKNKRLRPSVLFKIGGKSILIDTSPDFRQQALTHDITDIDAVLLTHVHYDHISGIDELRVFYFHHQRAVPYFGSIETYEEVKIRFHYLLDQTTQIVNRDKKYDFKILEDDQGEIEDEGEAWRYFSYEQAGMKVTGYRIKNTAYVTDIRDYDDAIFDSLKGVETLIVSALRFEPSPVHLSISEAIAFSERVGAKQTYFVHIAHELEHESTETLLPPGIHLAYDGLKIPVV